VSARTGPREDGSAGLLAVWAAALVVLAAVLVAGWAGVVVARHRAGSVADLAALAAARAVLLGGAADPCLAAGRVTIAGGGRLESCRLLADGSTGVVVAVDGPAVGGPLGWLRTGPAPGAAPARGGPPNPPPGRRAPVTPATPWTPVTLRDPAFCRRHPMTTSRPLITSTWRTAAGSGEWATVGGG
jgi:secretion/DNA translocation related TadE-like protein